MPKTNQREQDENWNEGYGHLGGRGWREGWDDAMHRGQGPHAGRGPRNFRRLDSHIEEDINERLTEHSWIDATDVEVSVENGNVTLRGRVDNREAKELAEEIAESVYGIKSVENQIRVKQRRKAS
jgi:osmotically-inducible protein OsmY